MKRVGFAPAARADLLDVGLYIAQDNPERAVTFVAELETKTAEIAQRPDSFPARDDLSPGLRVAVHGRYLLFFRELTGEVRIVRVLHGARDLARIFNR